MTKEKSVSNVLLDFTYNPHIVVRKLLNKNSVRNMNSFLPKQNAVSVKKNTSLMVVNAK